MTKKCACVLGVSIIQYSSTQLLPYLRKTQGTQYQMLTQRGELRGTWVLSSKLLEKEEPESLSKPALKPSFLPLSQVMPPTPMWPPLPSITLDGLRAWTTIFSRENPCLTFKSSTALSVYFKYQVLKNYLPNEGFPCALQLPTGMAFYVHTCIHTVPAHTLAQLSSSLFYGRCPQHCAK